MKIKKIQSINFIAFKNFQWNTNVPIFHNEVNILLGWNGSGKTIISRLLRSYEKGKIDSQDKINEATFSVKFDNELRKQSDLAGFKSKIRVFNEDYVEEIIRKTHLEYVIAFGPVEVNISEKQEELNITKDDLSETIQCKNEHDDIAKNTSEHIRRIQGIANIKKDSSVESSGYFDSYNKSSFEKRISWLASCIEQGKNIESFIQSESELQKLEAELSNLLEKKREYEILKKWSDWRNEKLETINLNLQFLPIHKQSKRLERYQDGSKEENWIRDGIKVHKLTENENNQIDICLFCDSAIKNRDELLKHFSSDIIKINDFLDTLDEETRNVLSEISSCKTFYTYEKNKLETFFKILQEEILKKRKNKLKIISRLAFNNLFTEEDVFNVESAAWKIEIDYVARKYKKYQEKKTKYQESEKSFKKKQENHDKLEEEIKELKKEAKNIIIPIERINKLLESTFPYRKIELDDSKEETGYVLKRDGTKCNLDSLSEGERNFLALAYFLLSINDEYRKLDEESIVVIDDPVSSLDSNSLFQVYAILFGEIEKNKDRQYFILTHNLDFFGQLIQGYKKANGQIKDELVNFYQIRSGQNGSTIDKLSDSLKNYRSDYQYTIFKLNEIKDSQSLDDNILAANLLRRALETFLHFKYGYGDLRSKMKKLYLKYKEIKLSKANPENKKNITQDIFQEEQVMYRFINHGSHEFLGIEKYDISVLQGSGQRIRNFLEVIKTIDEDHYKTFIMNS